MLSSFMTGSFEAIAVASVVSIMKQYEYVYFRALPFWWYSLINLWAFAMSLSGIH
jgi:hypothetical protein